MTTEFEEAAERHLDDVHAFLVYLTGDRNVAEELTAETFARACERWRRFDPRRGSARTWLCQLARSTALDHFRAEDRRRRREGRYAVGVPESQEAVFGESAGRVLGISATACSTRLSRALQKLEREVSAGVAA